MQLRAKRRTASAHRAYLARFITAYCLAVSVPAKLAPALAFVFFFRSSSFKMPLVLLGLQV